MLIPPPEALSPDGLGSLLQGLCDPAPHAPRVEMGHWRQVWEDALGVERQSADALAVPSVDT